MDATDDIEVLLRKMEEHFADAKNEGARRMFTMLVHTVLEFRDMLAKKNEPPLSVGETKEALGIFMDILKTQKLPDIPDPRVKELVMRWLEEVRKNLHH